MNFTYLLLFTLESTISGLDFDPLGTSVASISYNGACLISDIDTNSCTYYMELGINNGNLFVYSKRIKQDY